jgi:hypothetical protein
LKNTLKINGTIYATLDDAPLNGGSYPQQGSLPMPVGWQIVDSNEFVRHHVIAPYTWSCHGILLNHGIGVGTATWHRASYVCGPGAGKVNVDGSGKYYVVSPWGAGAHMKILISRPATADD